MNKYYKKWFLPLSAPAIILFFLVVFVPFIIGVFYSFTAWKGTFFLNGKIATSNPFEAFVGLQNYVDAVNNEKFQIAFGNTIKFTVIAVVAINVTALLLALMLTSIKKFAGFFRVVFFMPNLLGGLALGFIWQFIFEVVFSQIFFGPDGLVSVEFLTNMTQGGLKSIFALVILVAWQMVGYMMIIYVAGLNNISDDLYEAAQIDGAGAFTMHDHSVFMGFAPMNKPKIAIAVYVENGGWGATYGVPVGALMMEQYINGKLSPENELRAEEISNRVILYGNEER